MDKFNIPVVLFFFKREDVTIEVVRAIKKIKPRKIYLLCDGGRNEKEHEEVINCREAVEKEINWDCEIIKKYSNKNIGVYKNIGEGAKWVFDREEVAIFLEDDNLPQDSFFNYCEELLNKYKDVEKVLWICGTNYLEEFSTKNNESYVFTKHLLPCGWASWAEKFNKFYDGELKILNDNLNDTLNKLESTYENKALYRQQKYNLLGTKNKIDTNINRASWDHQMSFSLRINNLYGISPKVNLIKNIGVDERSTHGGTSMKKVMTKRFCGMDIKPINTPLIHPKKIELDKDYEKIVGNIILLPLYQRIPLKIIRFLKPLFGYSKYESVNFRNLIKKALS